MLSEIANQLFPPAVIFGGRRERLVPERVRFERRRELARHEAQFDKRANAVRSQAVVNLIDVGPIVDWPALRVLVVDAYLVVENGMKTDILNAGGRFRGTKVTTVAIAQGQDGTAGTEHLFPKVRERLRRRLRLNRYFLGSLRDGLAPES